MTASRAPNPSAAAPIVSVVVRPYSLALRPVVHTARGVTHQRTGWHVCVAAADGRRGVGDVAPWPGFGSDTARCAAALAHLAAPAAWGAWPSAAQQAAQAAALPVEVASGLSCALGDIEAQRAGLSLAAHLAAPGAAASSVRLHALVDNALQAQAAVAAGYSAVKVKVGVLPLADEVTRLAALRAAIGPQIGLRLDANGAFCVAEALRAARLFAMLSPEWLEQPVAQGDIGGMAQVRRLGGVPIAADESVSQLSDLEAIIAQGAADVIVIKPMFVGTLRQAVGLGARARAAGLKIVVTHALESAVGRLAALHVALALRCGPACGLAGPLTSMQLALPPSVGGQMRPFAGLGLGLDAAARAALGC